MKKEKNCSKPTFRHLLSDQSDPFNRAPLTMDQVLMLMKVWQLNNESFFFIALVLICNVVMRMVGFIADCND